MQLVAFKRESEMDTFVSNNGLHDLPQACVQRDGQTFHVLLLGTYPTREAAQQAAATRPALLRTLTPWLRPLHSLQQALTPSPCA